MSMKQIFIYKEWITPFFIENSTKLLFSEEAIEDHAAKKCEKRNIIELCQANKNIVLFLQIFVIYMAFASCFKFVILGISFLIINRYSLLYLIFYF